MMRCPRGVPCTALLPVCLQARHPQSGTSRLHGVGGLVWEGEISEASPAIPLLQVYTGERHTIVVTHGMATKVHQGPPYHTFTYAPRPIMSYLYLCTKVHHIIPLLMHHGTSDQNFIHARPIIPSFMHQGPSILSPMHQGPYIFTQSNTRCLFSSRDRRPQVAFALLCLPAT